MKYFLLLFLFISTNIFAQYEPRIETPFNSFTKLPSVEWAISANDTLVCLKPDVRKDLINKTKANKILSKINVWDDSKGELDLTPSSLDDILVMLYGFHDDIPMYDMLGNEIKAPKRKIEKDYADGLLRIHQKFYIENGKLKSYVSYVSPMKKIVTPQGIDLGSSEIFSTAFNRNYNYTQSQKDSVIFITKTERELSENFIKKYDKYKETFGRNMIETLWPYVLANKLKVYDIATDELLKPDDINILLLGAHSLETSVRDSTGKVTSKIIEKHLLPLSIFTKVIINQTWFYNESKNIVFNKIPEIILFAKRFDDDELKPILKISFTK